MFICLCVVITCIQVSHHISVFYECVWEFIILYTRIDIFVLIQLKRSVYKYIHFIKINIFFNSLSLSLFPFFFVVRIICLCFFFLLYFCFVNFYINIYTYFWFYANVYFIVRYVKYMQMVNDSFLILSYIYIRYILRLVIIFGFSIFIYILYYYIYVKVLHSFFSLLLFFFYK